MESVKNVEQVVKWFEFNNYYYQGQQFDNVNQIEEAARSHFEDCGYNTEFLKVDKVEVHKFYNEETNCIITLSAYEAHAGDSGVGPEDYFYGYVVTEE